MPAGLLELECLAHRFHVRAAVLSPERQQIIWVGTAKRRSLVLLHTEAHWSLVHASLEDPGTRVRDAMNQTVIFLEDY
eukprot:12881267-Prorocentrum_lima.AAC.1